MAKRSIHWFRKGLRIHDNPSLVAACENAEDIKPIFILDPWFPKNGNVGINRWRFLLQSLQDLDANLQKINSRLFIVKGKPLDVLSDLFKKWNITTLTYEVDTEPYAKLRDAEVDNLARECGVEVIKCVSHTLYDTKRIVEKNGGSAPLTYKRLQTVVSMLGSPPKPVPVPPKCQTSISKDHDQKYAVPTLEDLGKVTKECGPCLFPGGETEALTRLDRMMKKTNWVCNFEKPKTAPNSLEPSTTVLSPYLKFGCLSSRTMYHRLTDIYRQNKKHTAPPVSLEGQLLWREFFYTVGSVTPNFDQMVDNPICIQIPWDTNAEFLEAWKEGRTGFPFIDAIMNQLRQEGWIHHLARHAVACFLTRGHLYISWEEGKKVFEEYLLDADWSLNAANWMWLSASSFFYQYFRVYSPIAFGKKTDKDGNYIRKYVPVLKNMPTQYIYEPWSAPLKVQEKAGCIVGRDYPKPIVDHEKIRPVNIQRMATAYKNRPGKSDSGKSQGKGQKRKTEQTTQETKRKKPKTSGKSSKITDFMKGGD